MTYSFAGIGSHFLSLMLQKLRNNSILEVERDLEDPPIRCCGRHDQVERDLPTVTEHINESEPMLSYTSIAFPILTAIPLKERVKLSLIL